MATPRVLGQFEQTVLSAVLHCGRNAYGVSIHEAVEKLAARHISAGAVYATLDRLEDKDLVSSWMSSPRPARGGRAKRHYRVEQDGERALRESLLAVRRLLGAMEEILGKRDATTN